MGDIEEDQPTGGLFSAARATPEQPGAALPGAPASPEPSSAAGAGQAPHMAPHHAASGPSLDLSSELGAGTLSLLFPSPRPGPAPAPMTAPDGESAASAAHDAGAGQEPPSQAPLTHPLTALDIETQRLMPARSALETETQRLPRRRPTIETETQRISLARQRGETSVERHATESPATEAETQRLPPKVDMTDAETFRLAPKDGITDAETFRLAPKDGITDAETFRLAPTTPRLGAGAEPPAPIAPDSGRDYALPPPITPETLDAAHASRWSADDQTALEDTLQREASDALASLSALFTAESAATEKARATRARPTPLLADAPGDGTLSVVQALRVEIDARAPLRQRVLALVMRPTVAIMALFAAIQMAILSLWRARVAPEEIASLQDGLRMVQGYSPAGGYQALAHVVGALLWVVVASAGYLIGGLTGGRLIAIVCMAASGVATASAAKNLFGQVAGLFTAVAFALSGPVIYRGHFAVPDQLALLGVAVSLWAITQASVSRRDRWLIIAACACSVSALVWSPAILALISLAGVALALRGRPVFTGLYIAALIAVALVVSRVLPAHESFLAVIPQRSRAGLSLSLSASAAGLESLYDGVVVWALAIAGWVVARRWNGWLAAALVTGMLIWPVYLALAGDGADIERLLVFGFVFGVPLAGAAIAALWHGNARSDVMRRARVGVLLLAIGLIGGAQARAFDGGSGPIAPHAIHVVVGKADAGAPNLSAMAPPAARRS